MNTDHFKWLSASLAIVFIPLDLYKEHYYLDPGTGSLLIQLAIGALVGGWFVIKNYWIRIKAFFNKRSTSIKHDENVDE